MQSDPLLTFIRDPRLADHAVSAAPVWLWAADGTRVLWANAAGAAVLGAAHPHALTERRMSAAHPLASQVVRLAGTLPHGATTRLERLRGIGALGRTVVCACARFALANGMPAILIAANETIGPALPPAERVARLFAGSEAAVAAFAADGALLHATPAATARLGEAANVAALAADSVPADARTIGHASGESAAGPLTLHHLGSGGEGMLVAIFSDVQPADGTAQPDPLPKDGEREPPAERELFASDEAKPLLTLVPPAKNVVPFRAAGPAASDKRPVLSPVERTNFREIAKVLGASADDGAQPSEAEPIPDASAETVAEQPNAAAPAEQPAPGPELGERIEGAERALRASEAENRELRSIIERRRTASS
jgi:PAS domain-containing protein